MNRLYLVTGLILSFIIPALKFQIFSNQHTVLSALTTLTTLEPDSDYFQPSLQQRNVVILNYLSVLPVIYFFGVLYLFFRLLFSTIYTLRKKENTEVYYLGNIKILRTDTTVPFSFFNKVFLPKDETDPMIIEHELAHVRQFHWLDLILAEITTSLLWFNPFAVLYKSTIKLQHEYLADSSVISTEVQFESYLACMLRRVQAVTNAGVVSNFYCKTIKKRIIMLTKNKTPFKYSGMYLLMLPVICVLFFAFSIGSSVKKHQTASTDNESIPSIFPLDKQEITSISSYGKRINPFSKKLEFHYGVDFASSAGNKVFATAKGLVIEAKFDTKTKKGNYIIIKHNETYSTFYSQLKSFAVKEGDQVEKGQLIGYVGSSGLSTGPHLHYEVHKNGERVNPNDYLPK